MVRNNDRFGRVCIRIFTSVVSLAILIQTGGCALSKPKPPAEPLPPPAMVTLMHFSGAPLSGATTAPVSTENAASVRVSAYVATGMPTGATNAFAASARLVTASRDGSPLQPTAQLIAPVRILRSNGIDGLMQSAYPTPTSQNLLLGQMQDALFQGATSQLDITDQPYASRRFRVLLNRPDEATLQVGLYLEDYVTTESAEPSAPARALQKELALLDPLPLDQPTSLLIAIPAKFPAPYPQNAVVVHLQIQPTGEGDAFAAAVEKARTDLAASIDQAGKAPSAVTVGAAQSSAFDSAITALSDLDRRRSAMVYIAAQTGATLCESVAMVARDEVLDKLATKMQESTQTPESRQPELLGWICDLSSFQLMTQLFKDKSLPPELTAVLTQFAGEAGRHESSIEELGKNLSSKADLDNRLIAENLIYLEDNSPAARVRAFDWLNARGKAPAGFDPLGSPRDRRNALEKAFAKPAGGAQP